ncbi:glycoside hydrolase 5 family protein [Devriesea agamarum]|uniref:glycoside hydrolase 5 family protein n=1 Tax=Devriesea agamarum TaxID=472569 RepID=UPI00071CBFDA|nr:cellulase family glycosylhydrolase [Devriesea agamarum]
MADDFPRATVPTATHTPAAQRISGPRFGVNYTPREGWFHHWLDLDLDSVRADLTAIAELGLDHIRLFPLWPILQPNRTLIRSAALDQVRSVVDAAAEVGLDATVDALQGHLSSFDFVPSWLTTWHRRNMFSDTEVVTSTAELVRRLTERLADAPNFLGTTLGNEINQFSGDPHPDPDRVSVAGAEQWTRTMLSACREAHPEGLHTLASYDAAWHLDAHPFTPTHSAQLGDATVVHSWVFNGTAQRYGARSFETSHHAEYFLELARGFQTDPSRPVWLQEVGAPLNVLDIDDVPGFIHDTVTTSLDCTNLWGITWWCSHDVSTDLADFPPLEHTLGLFDANGKVKESGRVFGELAAAFSTPAGEASRVTPAPRTEVLDLEIGTGELPLRAQCAPGGAFFERWMQAAKDGARPAVRAVRRDPSDADCTRREAIQVAATGGAAATRAG